MTPSDVAADFAKIDFLTSIEYQVRANETTYAPPITLSPVLVLDDPQTIEDGGETALYQNGISVLIPYVVLGVSQRGDKFEYQGVTFSVVSVVSSNREMVWRVLGNAT